MLDLLNHLWLPSIILAVAGTAQLIRVLRANLLDELRKPYVITARAKGLAGWRIIMKYPLRVALNPLVSTIGYLLPLIVSGSIIISVVMSLPTVGPLLLKALLAQDMFLAGTIILLIGVMTVIGTFISDLLLAWIDPRIQLETT
jgi:peptide/nickel transport system permease protein